MKFFSRNSRATGPKIRVPRGLRAASISTAAFSSKAIEVPSLRPNGLRVRTTTAWTTSPFLTAPCGLAVLTVAVHRVQVLDEDASLAGIRLDDAALLPPVLAREDLDDVALAYFHGLRHVTTPPARVRRFS